MSRDRKIREIRPVPRGGIEEHGKKPANPPAPPKAQQSPPPKPPSTSGQGKKSD